MISPAPGEPISPPTRLRWPDCRRLRKPAEFKAVYHSGRRLRGRHHTLFGLRQDVETITRPWRLGITTSGKVGGAVQRNRMRRRVREFFRMRQHRIPDGWDFVVNPAPSLRTATPRQLTDDLTQTLGKMGIVLSGTE